MSLKQEIETWVTALARYDNQEYEEALGNFDKISDTSKILFNIGVIHATLGEHEKAVEAYQRAIRLDQYLAVAYFQQGVSNFLLGDFEEALANFNDTLLYLRGNTMIDYAQLGLMFRLYSCEVLFNRGLCYINLKDEEVGMKDLEYAKKEKVVEDHSVIDEAYELKAKDFTVFSIPVGVVYRPNEAKVRNLKTKDYLGKARLVAASDRANAFTGFAGSEIKNAGKSDVKDDRPADNISYAATNLVKPGLSSRRQQSEPPSNRNVFPPTPPPENDRPAMSRGASVRNGPRPMPPQLDIEKARPGDRYERMSPQDQRSRPSRAASATPARGYSQRGDPRRRPRSAEEDQGYLDDVYDTYGSGGSRGSRLQRRPTQRYIEEEEEDGSDLDDPSVNMADFEFPSNNRRAGTNSMSGSIREPLRKVERIDVLVTYTDRRMLTIPLMSDYNFDDFLAEIRGIWKIPGEIDVTYARVSQSGITTWITMAAKRDFDLAVSVAKGKAESARDFVPWGELEVKIEERPGRRGR